MSESNRNTIGVGLVAALFYLPFLGGVHLFDWDEINFAEIAREMIVLDDYLRIHIHYESFTEKPPLFFWLQALAMQLFGVNEYAARFPNALAGITTLMLLYRMGEKLKDKTFGLLWAGAYFGSVLPALYFKSGIIDPWFNLFIFLGLYHLILLSWKKAGRLDIALPRSWFYYLFMASLFTGLGILTKGPVAFLLTVLTLGIYWVSERFRFFISPLNFGLYTLLSVAVPMLWFGLEALQNGPAFMIEFTIRQWMLFSTPDAGHGGFPGYHFVVLLAGCFPASVFLLRAHGRLPRGEAFEMDFRKWMFILFWVVLILFSIVKSKIVHYSSMAYFPLTYLAALVAYYLIEGSVVLTRWMKRLLLALALLCGSVLIALPFVGMRAKLIQPYLAADPFAMKNLDAEVPWTGVEALSGVLLIGLTWAFLYFARQKRWKQAFGSLFGGTAVFVFVTLILVIGKIERISQRAAIEFYKTKQDCNCYVVTERFKSYAQLFYTQVSPDSPRKDSDWLKYGEVDKDVYFVAKVNGTEELEKIADVRFLYEKNGFTFWERKAKKSRLSP
jgi:4-amino-4-deoxy-L-arabinose transferase-like glycosyltransferase